jgi:3-oxoacyl-[acyl-carrier protein] reductase
LDISYTDLDRAFRVNTYAPLWFAQQAARDMLTRRRGRIITVTSIAGDYSLPDRAVYEASKAALTRIVKAMARELAGSGIQVNAVAPGLAQTGLSRDVLRDQFAERASVVPLGRAAEADEVANVLEYLVRYAPDSVTGAVFVVDGGRLA